MLIDNLTRSQIFNTKQIYPKNKSPQIKKWTNKNRRSFNIPIELYLCKKTPHENFYWLRSRRIRNERRIEKIFNRF